LKRKKLRSDFMAKGARYKVKQRRRREGVTNIRKRLALIKSGKPRLVARVSSNMVIAQIVEYLRKGDKTLVNTTSLELKKYGWKGHQGNVSAAYLTGLLCGVKALKKKINKVVLDTGIHTPVHGSNIFGVLKGALDAGLDVPHDEKALPSEERIFAKANASDVKEKILSSKVKLEEKGEKE